MSEKLMMKEADIVKEFKESKNKREQIGILADQNLCTRNTIIKVLEAAGEILPEVVHAKKEKVVLPEVVKMAILKMVDELEVEICAKRMEIKKSEKDLEQLLSYIN